MVFVRRGKNFVMSSQLPGNQTDACPTACPVCVELVVVALYPKYRSVGYIT
jgi:hypothetical protein